MKKTLVVLFFSALSLFGYMIPSWYPNKESKIIYSYGDGLTQNDAKLLALENLKEILISKGNVSNLNSITVNELEIIKEEVLENRYFLQVSYENRTLLEKLELLLQQEVFKSEESNNNYLNKTDFMQTLYNKYGYYPKIEIDTNTTSFIKYKQNKIELSNEDKEMLYLEYNDANISMDIKSMLIENETYFIGIDTSLSGFLSLFQISNNHDVEMLFENKDSNISNTIIYPNFKESDGLTATLENNDTLQEIYNIAVVCPNKKDFSEFNNKFKSEIVTGKFGSFIYGIQDCRFSSILTTIQKQTEQEQ